MFLRVGNTFVYFPLVSIKMNIGWKTNPATSGSPFTIFCNLVQT